MIKSSVDKRDWPYNKEKELTGVPDNLELSNDDEFEQGYQSEEVQRSPGRKQSFE